MIEYIRKNNKGITMVALALTIAVLLILTGIIVKFGSDAINETKLQNMKANMLIIEAEAKEYIENANFDLGIKPNEATQEMKDKANSELKGTKVTNTDPIVNELKKIGIREEDINNGKVYKLSTQNLQEMNIKGIESNEEEGWFIIVYDIENINAKIYNTEGVKIGTGETKYALDDIRDINSI